MVESIFGSEKVISEHISNTDLKVYYVDFDLNDEGKTVPGWLSTLEAELTAAQGEINTQHNEIETEIANTPLNANHWNRMRTAVRKAKTQMRVVQNRLIQLKRHLGI